MHNDRAEKVRVGRLSWRLFAWAVLLNFPWEMGQVVAYTGTPSALWQTMQDCGVHSLIDGILVLGIFWVGVLIFGNVNWMHRPGVGGYVWMGTTGFFLSVVIELNAVYRLGKWGYRSIMPLVPGLGVGLLPVLQMLVLPPLIFALVSKGVNGNALLSEVSMTRDSVGAAQQ